MPYRTDADMVYDIFSHEDVLGPYLPEYRDVIYECPHINYRDASGNLIYGGLSHKVTLLYVRDHGIDGTRIVGGMTVQPNETQTTNSWLWSRDGPPYETFGMQAGETATNGLNGGSYWIGGIDLNGNGTVGTYTDYDDGTWSLQFESNEGMVLDEQAFSGAHYFSLNGVPAHPSSGAGPMTIESIDICAPWTLPQTCALLTASLDAGFPLLAITNFPSSSTVTVHRCEDLMTTNWISVTNMSVGFTNWIDYTLTGDWDRVFYKLSR